jgi:Flp pilus assembly protein TadG
MKQHLKSDHAPAFAVTKRTCESRQRGQALVEMALVVPIFLIIVMSIVDFGWALRDYITITNAAREGARLGVLGCANTTQETAIKQRVVDYSGSLLTATSQVQVDANPSTTGVDACSATSPGSTNPLKIKASYTYNFITPLGSFVSSLSGKTLTLSSSTTMRVE